MWQRSFGRQIVSVVYAGRFCFDVVCDVSSECNRSASTVTESFGLHATSNVNYARRKLRPIRYRVETKFAAAPVVIEQR